MKRRAGLQILLFLIAYFIFAGDIFAYYLISDTIKPIESKSKRAKIISPDSTCWISQADKIILGTEIRTSETDFSFYGLGNNLSDSLYDYYPFLFNRWKYKSGFSPISSSYYIATRYGKFNFYSHSILKSGPIKNPSTTRYVYYGYGHTLKNVNISLSYRKITGFERINDNSGEKMYVSGTNVKDYRLSFEFIKKKNLSYRKFGYGLLYIPIKPVIMWNFKTESNILRFGNEEGLVPFFSRGVTFTWQNPVFIQEEFNFMHQLDIFIQSFYLRQSATFPFFVSKGDRSGSFSFKIDFSNGYSLIKYFQKGPMMETYKSKIGIIGLNQIDGSLGLFYMNESVVFGFSYYLSYFSRINTSNQPLHINYKTHTFSLNFGYRIPFTKGYRKIDGLF